MVFETTPSDFNQLLSEKKVLVCLYSAQWCIMCRQIAPFYEKLSEKYPEVHFAKMDMEKNAYEDAGNNVTEAHIPLVLVFKDGVETGRINEMTSPKQLMDLLD